MLSKQMLTHKKHRYTTRIQCIYAKRYGTKAIELELHIPLFFPNHPLPFFSLSEEPFLSLSLREAILAGATGYSSAMLPSESSLTTPQQCQQSTRGRRRHTKCRSLIHLSRVTDAPSQFPLVLNSLELSVRQRLHSRASFYFLTQLSFMKPAKSLRHRGMHPNKHSAIFLPHEHVTDT